MKCEYFQMLRSQWICQLRKIRFFWLWGEITLTATKVHPSTWIYKYPTNSTSFLPGNINAISLSLGAIDMFRKTLHFLHSVRKCQIITLLKVINLKINLSITNEYRIHPDLLLNHQCNAASYFQFSITTGRG